MTRYDRRTRLLAASLSALAGYVDAIGFIGTGGFFVSFMSGNSTRLGVGIAREAGYAAAGLIGAFVLGVVIGSLLGRLAGPHRRAAVLVLVAALLAGAASLVTSGVPWSAFLLAALAMAMGAENTIFEVDGEVRIGLTYMTGTLVKLGQRIAAALLGRDRWGWLPYLLLWLGLLTGAVAGALAYPHLGLGGLWIASGIAAVLALAAWRIGPDSGLAEPARHP